MVRVSNFIVGFMNAVLLILGLVTLSYGIYYVVNGSTVCEKGLTDPLLILGCFLVAVALLGLIGFLCKSTFLMFVYLGVMFFLIVGLIGFTGFLTLVTNKSAGKVFSEKGIKEHRTGDYSNWLQNHVVNHKNWNQIKSCLIDANLCKTAGNNANAKVFLLFKKTLPPVQGGCCKPPTQCGFHAKNETYWEAPKKGPTSKDHDCLTWSNNQLELCYDCNSCKQGVLAYFRKEWRQLAIINAILLFFLICVYGVGCCAKRSNQKSSSQYIKGFA